MTPGGPGFELELLNTGAAPIDLAGYRIISSRAERPFPLSAQTVAPGELRHDHRGAA